MPQSASIKLESNIQERTRFILDLVEYSIKTNPDKLTKERLIGLIEKEIDKNLIFEKDVLERIKKIEDILGISKSPDVFKGKLHRPSETQAFLALFNNSEGLKFLTHQFNDSKQDYNHLIEVCKKEFDESKQKYPNIPEGLFKRVEEYAFSKNPQWSIRKEDKIFKIQHGWSESAFIEWYNKEINTHPCLDARWKTEMVIPFKESIEIRTGNLTKFLLESIDLAFGNSKGNFSFAIDQNEINGAEFYSDVNMLQQSLCNIFRTIKEKAERNLCFSIKISYENETIAGGKFKKIKITHINSETQKDSKDPAFVKGDLKTIRNNLWSLCNYEIIAKFSDGLWKRIILTDSDFEYENYCKKNIPMELSGEEVKGFTHILKFY